MMGVYEEMTEQEIIDAGAWFAQRVKDLSVFNFIDQECELLDCPYCGEIYVFFPFGIERNCCWKDECWDKWRHDEEVREEREKREREEESKRLDALEAKQRAREEAEKTILAEEERRHRKARRPKPRKIKERIGTVYLMESVGYYKIGITIDIESRRKQIDREIPVPVRVVHHFASDYYRAAEQYLHNKYSDSNAEREWFALTPEQVEEIESISDYGLDHIIVG